MILHDYYYDYDLKQGHFEFFMNKEELNTIYELDLEYGDIIYYSPDIVDDDMLFYMTDSFVKELLENYIKINGLPESTYF
jgi:hypothetical protein